VITDVSTFVGDYPFRCLPDTSAESLIGEMDRTGIAAAWVGYLPSFLHRDPAPGTARLRQLIDPHAHRLQPVPTVHPGLPTWRKDLELAVSIEAPAVRIYPMHQAIDPAGNEMCRTMSAAAEAGVAVLLTVRFEDVRQRHPLDRAEDLPASAVRALARIDRDVKLLVTHAGREFIEEVHFGLTPEEQRRVLWDITWLWGPPSNDLGVLVQSIGSERFALGTGMPLRIPDAALAKLDLATLSARDRTAIEGENLRHWLKQ
jgi:predicted TIM-barrel fold metal-dependent hydrolase